MRHRAGLIGSTVLVLAFMAAALPAEVKTRGEIDGTVVGPDGAAVPAATVTLTGDALIQNEVRGQTNDSGRFRFLNLLPGQYTVTVGKDAFTSQQYKAEVVVGRTVTLDVQLAVAGVTEEMTVVSEAPVIDRGAPSLATGFDETELAALPTTRNLYDIVDAAPGMHNRSAYGAGGNVEGYDYFGIGAATNNYQLNGVTTNNLRFGNTWVLPNYDTIAQIQVTGPGAGAEYADYSGATVNIITKSGTNEYHGSGAVYYTNHHLIEDNSGGIKDLEQPRTKNNTDLAATLGGPIVKEKLTFFAGVSTNAAQNAPVGTDLYDDLDRESYSLRFDYAASGRHDLSAMYTSEPIQLDNLGLQAESGPEVGYSREQDTYTGFLSWIGLWGQNTISEVRYAMVNGDSARLPNADGTALFDGRVGLWVNTIGTARISDNERDHVLANVTHYADEFLKSSHELKVGLDYEDAWSNESQITSGDALMYIFPAGPNLNIVYAITNYNSHTTIALERKGAFAQDKISFGNATLSLGVRYDEPETSDDSTGKTIFDFDHWSPRVGFAYDFSGKGRSVGHASWGRYYDKVPTYGVGGYASAGQGPWFYYVTLVDDSVDPKNTAALAAQTVQPQNLFRVFETSLVPVESGIKNPQTDTFNIGFDQQIGRRSSVRINYVNRDSTDFIVLTQFANPHVYEPFSYTSSFTGNTFDIYRVLNPQTQRQFALGNRDFNEQESEMAILQFRHQPTDKLELDASVAWEHSTGTRDNNEVSILSLRTNGVDTDPNYERNPFYINGSLSQEREWNAKLRGFYRLPMGFNVAADVRWYSGHPFGVVQACPSIPGCNDPNYFEVHLEEKDARTSPDSLLTNLRASWDLRIGAGDDYTLSFSVDALNVFNEEIDNITNIKNNITDIYPLESAERGEVVNAFGRPNALERGREFRFGVRFLF